MPVDDPTELFDLCDGEGRLLGKTKARGEVHRDGDWHRSVHVWVVLRQGRRLDVVFQRRSLRKDSHPGRVDVSVAGHLRAGETPAAALREAEEEIGLSLAEGDLVPIGVRRRQDLASPPRVDREHQEVFFAVAARTLESLRPDPDEVSGLLAVPLSLALSLCEGEIVELEARELEAAGARPARVVLRRDELGLLGDGYFVRALRSIEEHLAGAPSRPWALDSTAS